MSQVDWSKAPEGAEYFCEMQWFKTVDGEWRVWSPGVNSWNKPVYAAPDNFSWWDNAIRRPISWNGEGLPPVGIECEYMWNYYKSGSDYVRARILAHDNGAAVLKVVDGDNCGALRESRGGYCGTGCGEAVFRTIRTPEQIAAEEREKAVAEMKRIWSEAETQPFHAIYDAGYRKQEKPE
ncbi:hypothetical protein [Pseudomonas sp.]|uniref:hypothetical protein n=1 Tax=Pseudomonas sp. TaxID=306 RepID=UPI00258A90E3|nr:hypothetical protein [Pseudomonas sp.]